jgi:tetratricopeptide (TPR) repeat protein
MTVETHNPSAAASKPGGFTIAVSKVEPAMTSPRIEIRGGLGNAVLRPGPAGSAKRASCHCGANTSQSGTTADIVKKEQQTCASGDLKQAEQLYRAVLDEEPENAVALNNLGILPTQTGKSESGEELIRKAIAVKPDYPDAHSNLGVISNSKPWPRSGRSSPATPTMPMIIST